MEGKARFFFVAHMFQTRNPISKVPKRPNFMRATRIPCYSSKWLGQFWSCFHGFFPSEMVPQFLATFYVVLFLQVSFKTSKVDDYYIYSYVFEEDLKWHQFFATCNVCILHKGTLSSLWNCLKMLAVGTLVPKCQKLNMFVSKPFSIHPNNGNRASRALPRRLRLFFSDGFQERDWKQEIGGSVCHSSTPVI